MLWRFRVKKKHSPKSIFGVVSAFIHFIICFYYNSAELSAIIVDSSLRMKAELNTHTFDAATHANAQLCSATGSHRVSDQGRSR